MNKLVVIAAVLLVGAAGMVNSYGRYRETARARRAGGYGYGTYQDNDQSYAFSDQDIEYYPQPSYQKSSYKGTLMLLLSHLIQTG